MGLDGAYALVMGVFLKQRMAGEPLTIEGDGEQTRDFTHVRDVVRANILAADLNPENAEGVRKEIEQIRKKGHVHGS